MFDVDKLYIERNPNYDPMVLLYNKVSGKSIVEIRNYTYSVYFQKIEEGIIGRLFNTINIFVGYKKGIARPLSKIKVITLMVPKNEYKNLKKYLYKYSIYKDL